MSYNNPGEVLTAIGNSIRTLYGSTSSIPYVEMPGLIKGSIRGVGIDLSDYNGTNWLLAFIEHIDFDEMATMTNLFSYVDYLTNTPAHSLSLENLSVYDKCNCSFMFYYSKFVDVNLSGWKFISTPYQTTSSLTFNSMFNSANISSLDFTGWDTSAVTSMKNMFTGATVTKMWVPSTFVYRGAAANGNPFNSGNLVIYTDASSASAQGWGTIGPDVVIHYNSTYQDFINA